jgi:catecholate siderophore receptor
MKTIRLGLLLLAAFTLTAGLSAATLTGTVIDAEGGAVPRAQVLLRTEPANRSTVTDGQGRFTFDDVQGSESLLIIAAGFTPLQVDAPGSEARKFVLEPAPVVEEITVRAPLPHVRTSTATKTDTPLREVPQSVTVLTRQVITQQSMQGMADVVRYVPGIGIAQGEGNRDTPVFRGNSSTSDFFVDGARDDVQYFRDLYNVERVEALKGPNAMIFGRGGVGGVLNRVTRQADWTPSRELTIQGGSWDDRRMSGDFGHVFSDRAAARVTAVYQKAESYREGAHLDRYGFNPTFAFTLRARTVVRAGVELFHDDRTADRGISSYQGRPVDTAVSTFFGSAALSHSRADVALWSASVEHRFSEATSLRSRLSFGEYDKFYQNVFPGAVDAAGRNVSISAYSNGTQRQNTFSQTDLVAKRSTGPICHTLLAGFELGRQVTDNYRQTGYFTAAGPNVTSVPVPLQNPMLSGPVTFRQSATDADNHSVAAVSALYLQDQAQLTTRLQAVAGLRYDRFHVDLFNNRTSVAFESRDGLVSPRLGLVYKVSEPVSLYASYSLSYLPRAGEQLASLSVSNQALDPEEFRNYEVGAKGQLAGLELSASVYRLERSNVVMPDPTNPSVSMLVDGQRSEGVELGLTGNITSTWSIAGGYAFQDGEILNSLSATARAGARLAQLPRHSASLWNKVDLSPSFGLGLGVIHRDEIFTSTDNTVTIPAFTRVDAALYYSFSERLRAQVNVENLLDATYYATAHSNNNITPGSPRALRVSWSTRF